MGAAPMSRRCSSPDEGSHRTAGKPGPPVLPSLPPFSDSRGFALGQRAERGKEPQLDPVHGTLQQHVLLVRRGPSDAPGDRVPRAPSQGAPKGAPAPSAARWAFAVNQKRDRTAFVLHVGRAGGGGLSQDQRVVSAIGGGRAAGEGVCRPARTLPEGGGQQRRGFANACAQP